MEANHTPGAAALLQQERKATDLKNHQERLAWLSATRPTWACGEPIDAYTRRVLIEQSRAAIAKATQ